MFCTHKIDSIIFVSSQPLVTGVFKFGVEVGVEESIVNAL
jgi:hypothetical protein